MRLTLAVLLALLTIYCNRVVVLSLPPSVIVDAASLGQRVPAKSEEHESSTATDATDAGTLLNRLWKKDTPYIADKSSGTEYGRQGDSIERLPSQAHHRKLARGGEYDLNGIQAAAQRSRSVKLKELLTPLRFWAKQCQAHNNCPLEYQRALFASSRQRETQPHSIFDALDEADADADADPDAAQVEAGKKDDAAMDYGDAVADADAGGVGGGDGDVGLINADRDVAGTDDILMLLTGEQDLIKFLHWAMKQLYPYHKFANKSGAGTGTATATATGTGTGADYYHPGMYNWKKLNLSGRLEPALLADEPHYIIVRREQLADDYQHGARYNDDPFIPPRGRKHNLPDLGALMQRYDTFVPNRGRRDAIKDIFKYDDLFYPNRGKRANGEARELALSPAMRRLLAQLRAQLQQRHANHVSDMYGDKSNRNDQSARPSMPTLTAVTPATGTGELLPPNAIKNALVPPQWRSMSPGGARRAAQSGPGFGAAKIAANRLHSSRSRLQRLRGLPPHHSSITATSSSSSSSGSSGNNNERPGDNDAADDDANDELELEEERRPPSPQRPQQPEHVIPLAWRHLQAPLSLSLLLANANAPPRQLEEPQPLASPPFWPQEMQLPDGIARRALHPSTGDTDYASARP